MHLFEYNPKFLGIVIRNPHLTITPSSTSSFFSSSAPSIMNANNLSGEELAKWVMIFARINEVLCTQPKAGCTFTQVCSFILICTLSYILDLFYISLSMYVYNVYVFDMMQGFVCATQESCPKSRYNALITQHARMIYTIDNSSGSYRDHMVYHAVAYGIVCAYDWMRWCVCIVNGSNTWYLRCHPPLSPSLYPITALCQFTNKSQCNVHTLRHTERDEGYMYAIRCFDICLCVWFMSCACCLLCCSFILFSLTMCCQIYDIP